MTICILPPRSDKSPTRTTGGYERVLANDDEARQLLFQMLQEIRITNLHLSVMTENTFEYGDNR